MNEVNGAHYKTQPGEQHHERVTRLGLGWYASNITKYAERAPFKGQQMDDMIKIVDYAAMWIAAYKGAANEEQMRKLDEVAHKLEAYVGTNILKVSKLGYGAVMAGEEAGAAYVNQGGLNDINR